ncbi:MAG: M23 family metallopeptidase [Rhodospirillales bacterium]|nr:M23 family metallopeptidase [Rhodospirillales bacterium]
MAWLRIFSRAGSATALALTLLLVACTTPGPPRIPDGGNAFIWPVEGTLLSAFGPKPGKRFNDGVNIAAPAGTPVRAAASGVVIYTGNELRSFGNLILIRHAGGWSSAYAHTETVRVRRNQRVEKGAVIAAVGRSGSVACPQLHFELRREAKAVDPFAVVEGRPRVLKTASGTPVDTGCPPSADGRPVS